MILLFYYFALNFVFQSIYNFKILHCSFDPLFFRWWSWQEPLWALFSIGRSSDAVLVAVAIFFRCDFLPFSSGMILLPFSFSYHFVATFFRLPFFAPFSSGVILLPLSFSVILLPFSSGYQFVATLLRSTLIFWTHDTFINKGKGTASKVCVLWGKKIISEIFTSFHLFSHAVYQNVEPALLAHIHYKGQPLGGFLCVQLLSLSLNIFCSYSFVSIFKTHFIFKTGNRKDAAACLTHALLSFSTSAPPVRWPSTKFNNTHYASLI